MWLKLEFPAEEQDCDAVVFEEPEAAGAGLDHLDLRVEALGHGVGDSVGDVVEQACEVDPVVWTADRVNLNSTVEGPFQAAEGATEARS